jgi:hypothetical protein
MSYNAFIALWSAAAVLSAAVFLTVLVFDSRDVYDSDDESDSASLPASFLSPSALACLLALVVECFDCDSPCRFIPAIYSHNVCVCMCIMFTISSLMSLALLFLSVVLIFNVFFAQGC